MSRRRACLVRQAARIETAMVREAEALVQDGYDVDLVIMRPPAAEYWGDLPDRVTVRALPLRRRRGSTARYLLDYAAFALLASLVVLVQHLRRPYDVVQVQSMPDALVVVGLLPRLLGAGLVMKIAEPTPQLAETLGQGPLAQRLLGRIQLWSAGVADAAVVVTDELRADLVGRGADQDRMHVVLNVPSDSLVDLAPDPGSSTAPDADRGFSIVCHGTILERYGQDTIVRAVARVRDRLPDARIVLTGSLEDWPEFKQLVADLGLGDVVEHHEWLPYPDLVRLVRDAHVGVVAQKPSSYSHLVHTNKMFEYLLLGVPAVVGRLGATRALLADDEVAWFDADDADDLARVLVALHDDERARDRLVRAGRTRWERCSWRGSQRAAYLGAVADAVARRRGR